MILVLRALVGFCLIAAPYIDAEVSLQLWGWAANAPLADGAALLSLLFAGALWLWRRPRWDVLGVVEALGWGMLWAVGVANAGFGADLPGEGPDALHTLVRKPIFLCLAWRYGFAEVVRACLVRGQPTFVMRALAFACVVCALVLCVSSAQRIVAGEALWWRAIEGLTNNHKTLAVFLAPTLPLLSGPVMAVVLGAIVLAWSKASWVTALFCVGWTTLRGRTRAWVLGAGTLLALMALSVLPYLARSPEQIDSLRSRMSLNRRAWDMAMAHPWLGYGAGTNVRYEVSTFPDYRVNGVDAHGVIAKLVSEFGIVGFAAWSVATMAIGLRLWRRAPAGQGLDHAILGAFLALHLNLLTSTEAFSQTHWAVLGLLCGLSARRR